MEDCTEACVADASNGPGDYAKRFRTAAPAKAVLTAAQTAAVSKYAGRDLGYLSKVLVYDKTFRYAPAKELRALYSAIKGGHLRVMRTSTGYRLERKGGVADAPLAGTDGRSENEREPSRP